LLLPWAASANIPAAYFACEGADNGAPCQLPGPTYGNCVLDTLCEDPATTEVNECLLCVDGCWGMAPDEFCVQDDGSDGVCRKQDQCTTDPEKSFDQCNWCVDGDIERTDPDSGCNQGGHRAVIPWLLILMAAAFQIRRGRKKA